MGTYAYSCTEKFKMLNAFAYICTHKYLIYIYTYKYRCANDALQGSPVTL